MVPFNQLLDETFSEILVLNARKIAEAEAWRPASVTIDKCRAELNAINSVWSGVQVRICQFHIMQAICRWDTETKSSTARPPGIARQDKAVVCTAFREAQRCRSLDDWSKALQAFEARIKDGLKGYGAAIVDQVLKYFATNWWSTPWHNLVTDIGLHAGQTRDEINTSNTMQRAFKTFDEIFLACRVNKRPKDRKVMLTAHHLWETRSVVEVGSSGTSFCVRGPIVHNGDEPKSYMVSLAASHLRCTCINWRQSVNEQEGIPSLRNANLRLVHSSISDATVDDDLDAVFNALNLDKEVKPATAAQSQPDSSPSKKPAARALGGRPAKVVPLHNRPSKSSKESNSALRFSKKPGPTRTSPWVGKHKTHTSSPIPPASFTTLAAGSSGPVVTAHGSAAPFPARNALAQQISKMDEATALRVQVPTFPSTYLVHADFK
ncbi:hypothetical protein CF319_g4848 [Tilletia indica]|nr:hypothetical protein CF319_g4848 [Tilletia indica]